MVKERLIIPSISMPEFSRPFCSHGVWSAEIPDGWERKRTDVTSRQYREVIQCPYLAGCKVDGRKAFRAFMQSSTPVWMNKS